MVAELTTDLGGLETLAVIGKLQPIDFPLLVLHALDRDAASVKFVEEHGVTPKGLSRGACRVGRSRCSKLVALSALLRDRLELSDVVARSGLRWRWSART